MRGRIASVRRSCHVLAVALCVFAIAPLSIFGAANNRSASQLLGYKVVRVHYGPTNRMIMSVRINGHPANLLVDTGASQIILDNDYAALAGIRPFQRAMNQVRFSVPTQIFRMGSEINGQLLPAGVAQNITAGTMNFGSNPVALCESEHTGNGGGDVVGMFGLDILFRYKALINCRTKLVFFKVDPAQRISLASAAASEKFIRVPIRREKTGALTVPCSMHGQSMRLLVDTGSFVTILHEGFVRSLGLTEEATQVSAQFRGGASKRINAAKINDLCIGTFKISPEKFGVTPLPRFALQQGDTRIAGILGMDTLYIHHAIIDLDGMNLFLK